MKMQVKAVTYNWTSQEITEKHSELGAAYLLNPWEKLLEWKRSRGRIVHLECGHEFQIPYEGEEPTHFDCRYCSHVPTIEEQREARVAHQVEKERRLR